MRFLGFFSVFLLLINPSIQNKITEITKPNLLVAVDNSTSIKFKLQDENVVNIVNLLKNNLSLKEKFDIKYYAFGNGLEVMDSLEFSEKHTNLSVPFRTFSEIYKQGINATVLITDGNQTIGSKVEFEQYESPTFPFIVGDTSLVEDLFVKQINVNDNSLINNKFPVEVFVNYQGNNNVSKNLSIYNKDKRLYSRKIDFSDSKNVFSETIYLTAEKKGNQFYSVRIENLKNEQNTINNKKSFSINVVEEKTNILVLTSIIHPDLGMLKKSIESDEQRKVSISKIDEYSGNASDYQLIILYQPDNSFKGILDEIKSKKSNHFIISGLSTDWKFLNLSQELFSKDAIFSQEEYLPIFNSNYDSYLSYDIGFSNFSPIADKYGEINFSIPYNTLLFQKIGNVYTKRPLLATFEKENQKGAVLFGENIWKWRMEGFKLSKSFELFDSFIANLVQYLSSNIKNKRLLFNVDPIFYSSQTIQVSASYLDKNFSFDSRAKLWLTVTNNDGALIKRVPFTLQNNKFLAEISSIPPNEYKFSITVENQDVSANGSFVVLPFEIEQQISQSNDKTLKTMAINTEGKMFYENQESELISQLLDDNRFKSIQKVVIKNSPLIDWKWVLGFIVFVFSLEWFTRKYFGKI